MTGIYDTCPECGVAITHQPGRGKARKYCGLTCKNKAKSERESARSLAVCCVVGCENKAVRVGAQMCESHYMRQRRNGTTDFVGHEIHGDLEHSGGYVLQAAPGHPRALGGHRAYQHRVVFTDAHGEGPFKCHWCGNSVTWSDMHVDHLDADKKNNDINNLVASCPVCNQQRGHDRMMETLRAKSGITLNGTTKTLNEWASEYGITRNAIILRMKQGWSVERAITVPRGNHGPKTHHDEKTAAEAKARARG